MKSCLRVAFFCTQFLFATVGKTNRMEKENFDGYDYIKSVIYGKIIQIKKERENGRT